MEYIKIMSILSHETFREAMPSQLSLFDVPPTQTAVENIYFQASQLTSQLWERDYPGEFDDVNAKSGKNSGLLKRAQFTKLSKTIDLEGPIMHELFQIDRYILNQVGISLKLYRTRPEFYLLSSAASGKKLQYKARGSRFTSL